MKKIVFIAATVVFAACLQEKKEISPLQPPSDEVQVQEEEKGFFESVKKELPEEKEKKYKTEFDADGVYWLAEPLKVGKYNVHSLTLMKSEAATLTLEVEETAEMIDLTAKKYTANQDTLIIQFSHKEVGTVMLIGKFTENPWGEKVEENETIVLKGKLKADSEGEKKAEWMWSSF